MSGTISGLRFHGVMACVTLLLSSCASLNEYARQAEEQRRQADMQRCADFGYAYGSSGHADCMMQLYMDRKEDERVRQAQYNTEATLREIREKDCETIHRRVKREDGTFETVERVVCR